MRKLTPILLLLGVVAWFAAFAGMAFGQATRPAATTAPATRPAPALDVPFTIGVWQADEGAIETSRTRGVDTFVGHVEYGGRMTKAEWERRVMAKGGRIITYPGADLAAEAVQPLRVGFIQKDEPDMSNHVDTPGYTIPELREQHDRVRATGLPMFMTVGAMDNFWYDGKPKPHKTDGSKYGHRAEFGGWFAYADVVGVDFYLYTHGRQQPADPNAPGPFDVIKRCLDRLHEWSGGKPIYLFVETSTQGKTDSAGRPRTMTADQWEQQVWHAVDYSRKQGYRLVGIWYFPHRQFPNWSAFDNTSPEVAERMTVVNAKLRQMFPPPTTKPTTQPADPLKEALAALARKDVELAAAEQALAKSVETQRQAASEIAAVLDKLAPRPPPTTIPTTKPSAAGPKVYLWTGPGEPKYALPGTLPVVGSSPWYWAPDTSTDETGIVTQVKTAVELGAPIAVDESPPSYAWTADHYADAIDSAKARAKRMGVDPARVDAVEWYVYGQHGFANWWNAEAEDQWWKDDVAKIDGFGGHRLSKRVAGYCVHAYGHSRATTIEQWTKWMDRGLPIVRAAAERHKLKLVFVFSPHPTSPPAGDPVNLKWSRELLAHQLAWARRNGVDCFVWSAPEAAEEYQVGRDVVKAFVEGRK